MVEKGLCHCGCGGKTNEVNGNHKKFINHHAVNHRGSPEERYLKYVIKKDGCWGWRGSKSGGYGFIKIDGRYTSAHRFSWELCYGKIPEGDGYHGTCVLHKCDNRECSNPDHLFLGSHMDNMQDMMDKGRRREKEKWGVKLTSEDVKEIKKNLSQKTNQAALARKYGVDKSVITRIKQNKIWVHI